MTAPRRAHAAWLLAAAVAVLALGFVFWRGQDKNWDLLNYHFYAGYSLLHGNYLRDIAPMGLVSFLNPASNVLAFLALFHLPFPASAWAIGLVQLLSLPLLVLIARQIGRDMGQARTGLAELLALSLCLLAPLWWSELGTTFADASTTPLVLLGVYLGLRGVAQGVNTWGSVAWAGVCMGLAAGFKLTNAPFAIALGLALVVVSVGEPLKLALWRLVGLGGGMAAGFLLTAWWNLYLLQQWGSPLFPLYNAWFQSPYADSINFRDWVWQFKSIFEFGRFLWDAVTGTAKTAEFAFADARLLVFFGLLVVALGAGLLALARGRFACVRARVSLALMVFLAVGLALWAHMFAYQRYMMPLEVLIGFGIWILLMRLSKQPKQVTLALAGCVLASAVLMRVPDWGHRPAEVGARNPFDMALPAEASASPARYLVVGNAISYILPSLHPDSRFYGVDVFNGLFSRQAEALVKAEVARPDARPLRILARQVVAAGPIWNILARFGWSPNNTGLLCMHFQTEIDKYVICEIQPGHKSPLATVDIDFQGGGRPLPPAVLGVRGLSGQEAWGRWSDGDAVQVMFANCLPTGRLKIDLRGHAFGPNIGMPIRLTLGPSETSIVLAAGDTDHNVTLENKAQCENALTIFVPHKISPAELGISTDSRTLGVGLVRLGLSSVK